jgi:glutathione peroxidase-family protein
MEIKVAEVPIHRYGSNAPGSHMEIYNIQHTTYGVMEFHYSITPYVGHMFKILIYGLNTYIN